MRLLLAGVKKQAGMVKPRRVRNYHCNHPKTKLEARTGEEKRTGGLGIGFKRSVGGRAVCAVLHSPIYFHNYRAHDFFPHLCKLWFKDH